MLEGEIMEGSVDEGGREGGVAREGGKEEGAREEGAQRGTCVDRSVGRRRAQLACAAGKSAQYRAQRKNIILNLIPVFTCL